MDRGYQQLARSPPPTALVEHHADARPAAHVPPAQRQQSATTRTQHGRSTHLVHPSKHTHGQRQTTCTLAKHHSTGNTAPRAPFQSYCWQHTTTCTLPTTLALATPKYVGHCYQAACKRQPTECMYAIKSKQRYEDPTGTLPLGCARYGLPPIPRAPTLSATP